MLTHDKINQRSLAMAQFIVKKIDSDPERSGVKKAQDVCKRWMMKNHCSAVDEWNDILEKSWSFIRNILLDESEEGQRLRQSSPFCNIMTNRERWKIYRKFSKDESS